MNINKRLGVSWYRVVEQVVIARSDVNTIGMYPDHWVRISKAFIDPRSNVKIGTWQLRRSNRIKEKSGANHESTYVCYLLFNVQGSSSVIIELTAPSST